MLTANKIAVTSRSFSSNKVLREQLAQKYPEVKFNDGKQTLENASLIDFLHDCNKAIVGLEKINAEVLRACPKLKVISRFGVGVDTLDLQALDQHQVQVATSAGANKEAVAELVIAMAINLLRQLPTLNIALRAGKWQPIRGRQLSNCTVGIIGYGAIGREVGRLLSAFNCQLLTYDLQDNEATLDALLQQSDVITLHLPLTANTKLLINREKLNLLAPQAIIINTARGELIDEAVLKEKLQNGAIAGAACDVFSTEPATDLSLLALPNFFATPHIGGSTEEAILAIGQAAINGLEAAKPAMHFHF